MESPITPASVETIAPPMSRLQAVVVLRRVVKTLIPHLANPEKRLAASKVLQDTSHVLAPMHPAVFGWAVRRLGSPAQAWTLERDASQVHRVAEARDEAGELMFEVVGLATMQTPILPAPSERLNTPAVAEELN